jgi:hypothetical protein
VQPAAPGSVASACCSKLAICTPLTALQVSTAGTALQVSAAGRAGLDDVVQGASAPGSATGSSQPGPAPTTSERIVLTPSSKRSTAGLPGELLVLVLAAAWTGDAPELQGFLNCTGVHRLSAMFASVLASALLVLPAVNLSSPLCCEHSTRGRT